MSEPVFSLELFDSSQVFPYVLARLLDSGTSLFEKRDLAARFCSLDTCCLDVFSRRLRRYMQVLAVIALQFTVCNQNFINENSCAVDDKTVLYPQHTDRTMT